MRIGGWIRGGARSAGEELARWLNWIDIVGDGVEGWLLLGERQWGGKGSYSCCLQGFGKTREVVDASVEDGDARCEEGEAGLEGGDAAGKSGRHFCASFLWL